MKSSCPATAWTPNVIWGTVDVVVVDWMLPGQSGVDLIRRARLQYPALPLLLLTARGDEDDRVRGLKDGADDYVVKPFSPREVLARVEALLRRANVRDVITLGDLVIGAQARTVTLAGTAVPFSRTEFELLLTLARHPGVAFSRERLLERVWGAGVRRYGTCGRREHPGAAPQAGRRPGGADLHRDGARPRISPTAHREAETAKAHRG